MKREQIATDIATAEQQIVDTEQTIKDARLAHEQAEARRRPLLLANDVEGLDRIDRELTEQQQLEVRGIERLAVLREELVRLNQMAERSRFDGLRAENETRAKRMTSRLDEVGDYFAKLVPLLAAQARDFELFESSNLQLKRAGLPPVDSPENARREPFVDTPERIVEEDTCPAGIYNAAGKALDPLAAAPTRTRTVIPATRTGGLQPNPVHLTTVLPPVFWGDPGWDGGERLGHHSAVESPATVRKATTTSPADAAA